MSGTASAGFLMKVLAGRASWHPGLIKGAINRDAFATNVRKLLVPELQPRTGVIVGNLSTHRNTEADKAMREAGCRFRFLPAPSPDLNPIEQTSGKLKARLRRVKVRSFSQRFSAIGEICEMFSPQECWNDLDAAGPVST